MKKQFIFLLAIMYSTAAYPQGKIVGKIKEAVTKNDAEAHLIFLASDEMRGRGTGSPEAAIAANYIATQFELAGLRTVGGSNTYFQEVGLQRSQLPKTLDLKLGDDYFKYKDDLLLLRGKSLAFEGNFVFVGYGNPDDFNGVDVKGKVVVAYTGSSEKSDARESLRKVSRAKYKLVREKGAVGLVEIVMFSDIPWPILSGFFGPRVSLADPTEVVDIPHLLLKKSTSESISHLVQQKTGRGTIVVDLTDPKPIPGKNVIGLIQGKDDKLKQEYIILSAHYDHLGVRKNNTPDSIYNGARDNALGTTAILEAAKFFARNPPRRSVLVMALCAEEVGLLGSNWYANHPLIPLKQTVYNLDCDGAGYNDKTIVTLIDLNRTTADALLTKGSLTFGLTLKGDPVPDQDLYERSDNYNFAVKGVPAVDFSPGIKSFDDELMKYYHQPPDEVSSLDFDYLEKFYRAYVYSAYLIANSPERPSWKAGDKFEEAGKTLYGSN
jgi:hypothetical protein